eukprot:Gb_29414 [translate_table: standard]
MERLHLISLVLLMMLSPYVNSVSSPSETPSASPTLKPSHKHSPRPRSTTSPKSQSPSPAPQPSKHPISAHSPAASRKKHPPSAVPVAAPAPGPAKPTRRPITNGTLDPVQVKALQSLGVTVGSDPCNTDVQQLLICDDGGPLKHLISLQLQYCSSNAALSKTALGSLGTLQSLSFVDCPMKVTPLPLKLADSLESFRCARSLGRTEDNTDLPGLSGAWLSKLRGLKELTITDVLVNATGLGEVFGNITRLQQVTFSNTNITGALPKSWPANLTMLHIAQNLLKGSIPSSISNLTQLQSLDLSFNNLTGHIPDGVGSLRNLQMLSLSSNRLSGTIPKGFQNLTFLSYLDLSNNQLNGTIPAFIGNIKGLRYLDLRNNMFRGVMPFNTAFVKNLNTFKVGANPDLCFNSSILLPAISGGAEPCDSKGLPSKADADSPAYAPDEFAPSPEPSDETEQHHHKRKGPKTVVWAVSIALASIVLVIIVAVVLSRWCAWRD